MASATRDDQSKWGKIGHPVQSRGLSPKDRTPWVTLIITALSCLGLGKAFLVLQANYETEGASWAAADAGVKLDSGGELGAAAAGSGVRRAGGGLGAADAAAVDVRAAVAGNALGSDAAAALSSAEPTPAGGSGAASPLDGVDASCNAELNLDLDGPAVSWGLDFKTVRACAGPLRPAARALSCAGPAGDGGGVLRGLQEAHQEGESARGLQLMGVVPRAAMVSAACDCTTAHARAYAAPSQLVARHLESHKERVLAQSAGRPRGAEGEPPRRLRRGVPKRAQDSAAQNAVDGGRAAEPRAMSRRACVVKCSSCSSMVVQSHAAHRCPQHPQAFAASSPHPPLLRLTPQPHPPAAYSPRQAAPALPDCAPAPSR